MKYQLPLFFILMLLSLTTQAQPIEELCATQTIDGTIVDFEEFNGEIYATGFFKSICDEEVNYVAKWAAGNWHPLGVGLANPGHALRAIDGQLFLAKYIESIDTNWLQVWNGSEWEKFGGGVYYSMATSFTDYPNIYDVIKYNGQIVACGEFDLAGNSEMAGIMGWNDPEWESLGVGFSGNIDNTAPVMYPHQMIEFEGDLIVCGNFKYAGSDIVNGIARWNGSEWSGMDEGFNNTVYGIGIYNGELYAGGAFTASGNTSLNRIAKWNGSEWISPGFGFQAQNSSDFIFVHTLTEVEDYFYIGGGLKKVVYDDGSEEVCGGLVRFDGSSVHTFDGGVSGYDIEAIISYPPYSLLVGGGVFGEGYLGEVLIGGTPSFEQASLPLEIFPNPVDERLTFSGAAEMGIGQLTIFSSLGHQILSADDFSLDNGIDVSKLLSGNYFVRFATGEKEYAGSFLKK